jgi:hypothetical protein
MIQIKGGSVPPVLLQWTPEVELLTGIVDEVLHGFGLHAFLTSGMEGTHRRQSKHYRGEAVDFRIVWSPAQRAPLFMALEKRLVGTGRYFLESDHLHVETI